MPRASRALALALSRLCARARARGAAGRAARASTRTRWQCGQSARATATPLRTAAAMGARLGGQRGANGGSGAPAAGGEGEGGRQVQQARAAGGGGGGGGEGAFGGADSRTSSFGSRGSHFRAEGWVERACSGDNRGEGVEEGRGVQMTENGGDGDGGGGETAPDDRSGGERSVRADSSADVTSGMQHRPAATAARGQLAVDVVFVGLRYTVRDRRLEGAARGRGCARLFAGWRRSDARRRGNASDRVGVAGSSAAAAARSESDIGEQIAGDEEKGHACQHASHTTATEQETAGVGRFEILRGITGYIRAGEVSAVMGASGCGKTTLLDVISGRATAGKVDGLLLYGGGGGIGDPADAHNGQGGDEGVAAGAASRGGLQHPSRRFLAENVGYVEQFDRLLPNLTPAETLLYTAELKRDVRETKRARRAAVERVIATLRLHSCRNVYVGDPLTKGISGGQAKRLSIGLSLVSEPRVLLLDEPTTGLDAPLAADVAAALHSVASTLGVAVCATVHAPTSKVFGMFDRLMLLGGNSGGDVNAVPAQVFTGARETAAGASTAEASEDADSKLPDYRDRGRVLYFGPLGEGGACVRRYLEAQGHPFPADPGALSTAEWMADVIGEKSGGDDAVDDEESYVDEDMRVPGDAEHEARTALVTALESDARSHAKVLPGARVPSETRGLNLAALYMLSDARRQVRRDVCLIAAEQDLIVDESALLGSREGQSPPPVDDSDLEGIVEGALSDPGQEGQAGGPSTNGWLWCGHWWSAEGVRTDPSKRQQPSQLRAIAVLLRYRGLRNLRSPRWIAPRLMDKIVYALVTMSLFWGVAARTDPGSIQSTVAVLFQLTALTAFSAAIYVPQLFLERPVFYRERADGLYRTPTYLAYNLIQEFGFAIVGALAFVSIVFWSIGFSDRGNFGVFLLIYYLSFIMSISAAYLAAAAMPALELANALVPLYMAFNLFFAGFLLPLPQIPQGWHWYTFINPLRFAFTSWLVEQYEGTDFVIIDGQTVLEYYGVEGETLALLMVYLALFTVVFVCLALAALTFIRHGSR